MLDHFEMSEKGYMRPRVHIRSVGESENLCSLGQLPCYTTFLADGVSAICSLENKLLVDWLLPKLGLREEEIGLEKISSMAIRQRAVWTVDLGDRKMFLTPDSLDAAEIRELTRNLLDYAASEKVSTLSYTHFSVDSDSFSEERVRSVLEAMLAFDASEGPYKIWFEVAGTHQGAVRRIKEEIQSGRAR